MAKDRFIQKNGLPAGVYPSSKDFFQGSIEHPGRDDKSEIKRNSSCNMDYDTGAKDLYTSTEKVQKLPMGLPDLYDSDDDGDDVDISAETAESDGTL